MTRCIAISRKYMIFCQFFEVAPSKIVVLYEFSYTSKRLVKFFLNMLKTLFSALALLLIYLVLFVIIRQLYPSDIIFYQGLYLIIFIFIIGFLMLLKIFKSIDRALYASIIFFLSAYSFHITIPSLLDRSISLFILAVTDDLNTVASSDYRRYFNSNFIEKNKAIEKRIMEQTNTGNLICENDNCSLSDQGRITHQINILLVKIFNTDTRYVIPEIIKQ